MTISDAGSAGLAMIAWVVAGALALGVGGAAFGITAYRRSRTMELRLRTLERAVREFCEALRVRVALQHSRAQAVDARVEARERGTEEAA